MRGPNDIVLISCYELGHQPLAIASAAGFLRQAGFAPSCVDLAIEPLSEEVLARCAQARLVAISTPMHTAMRLGMTALERIRAVSRAHLCVFGLYAPPCAPRLTELGAGTVLGGECEEALVELALGLERGAAPPSTTVLKRLRFAPPVRDGLPPLADYARLVLGDERRVAGYVEATRGCRHLCRHCPIPAVYAGRFFAVPAELVIEDASRQIAAGARHITFGDPDFWNAPKHGLAVVRGLRARHPDVTFDATIKVEHLLAYRELVPELAAQGCLFIVSAVESLSDRILRLLDKGHSAADVPEALAIVRAAGLSLRPTWLPFTPWTTLADYLDICHFIAHHELEAEVDPVQLSLRLLLPTGSLLLALPELAPHLGAHDAQGCTVSWTHPDERMDVFQRQVQGLVERAAADAEPAELTFARIHDLAAAMAGIAVTASPRRPARSVAHLSEPWFC